MRDSRLSLPREVIEQARALWDEGLSSREIARRIGRTSNSVIGMAHRYGFTRRANPVRPMTDDDRKRILALADAKPEFGIRRIAGNLNVAESTVTAVLRKDRPGRIAVVAPTMVRVAPKRPEREKPAPVSGAGGNRPSAASPTAEASPAHPRVLTAPLPAWIIGVKPGCSWPLGEPGTPGFRYCDAARVGRSYCAEHAAVAYRPATKTEERLVRGRKA